MNGWPPCWSKAFWRSWYGCCGSACGYGTLGLVSPLGYAWSAKALGELLLGAYGFSEVG
ncbi:hypothetical protein ACNF49_51710 [Actinomadura sp. ATCC 39365]